jgi:hypothetical protein
MLDPEVRDQAKQLRAFVDALRACLGLKPINGERRVDEPLRFGEPIAPPWEHARTPVRGSYTMKER